MVRVYRTKRPSKYGFRYAEWFHGGKSAVVHCRSVIDGTYHRFTVPHCIVRKIRTWETSEHLHLREAVPELSLQQQEMMYTGITDAQWKEYRRQQRLTLAGGDYCVRKKED